ncbi:MAG: beta-lactamase family protein [Balneolaceae bacterium]|nr:beta-lactamase family protein [Balneolaceae bacterium]MBO6546373.1 beta-lactamase family protein [Balneolaceae bacterium]MBO6648732.1 beta-lactamase family protein [Balneolaceae bacterium]
MCYTALVLSVVILFTLGCDNQNSVVIDSNAKERLSSTLKAFVDSGRVAGSSALIFEKGKEVYFGAFGDADREAGTKMNRNTIVQIYSMTKPITGTALMQQYEQDKFQLDDPLADYLPEFEDVQVFEGMDDSGNPILVKPKRPITVRDITRHTAGFANDGNAPYVGELLQEANLFNFENTLEQTVLGLSKLPLVFHPGEEWYYGPSVDVQARLVEVLSGQPFEEYLNEHILGPLEMNETRYLVPEKDRERMSSVYGGDENGALIQFPDQQAHNLNINEYPLRHGGWGLTSTLDDYQTFARMLVNEGTLNGVQILKPETVQLMATNHLADDVTERLWLPGKGQVGFGIDFAVRTAPPADENENQGVVGEFFWDGAATTLFWVDPANELTVVFFVQKFPFDMSLHKDFRKAVYDLSFD